MRLIIVGNVRRDGKQKVKRVYGGGPNMFGGDNPPKIFTQLLNPEQLKDALKLANDGVSHE